MFSDTEYKYDSVDSDHEQNELVPITYYLNDKDIPVFSGDSKDINFQTESS